MIAGVDGCKGGWVVAMGDTWPCTDPVIIKICSHFSEVLVSTEKCEVVVVDMPIGISNSARRKCDCLGKKALGRAHPRVFYTPPRQTLNAETYPAFLSIHRQVIGKGNSKQAFCILQKIKEVDKAIDADLQKRIFEFHPELSWKRLKGRVLTNKSTPEGVIERLNAIKDSVPGVNKLVKTGPLFKADDVLDALIGLSVADYLKNNQDADFMRTFERRLPSANPEIDVRGLRMEIWF